jgi:hypothetical protein
MTKDIEAVPVEDLRRVCDPSILYLTSTAELPTLTDTIGQERAMRATSFGIDIRSPGCQVFALSRAGTGNEGTELSTGIEVAEQTEKDTYPENPVNHAVQIRFRDLAEKVQAFSKHSNHPEPIREKEVSL